MRNFKNNNRRRHRNHSFDRNMKINSNGQNLNSGLGNVSDFKKKNYNRNNYNTSKLIQKYSDLAREALSSGDKILYENYMQYAEHFIRVSENLSQNSPSKNLSSQSLNSSNIAKIKEEDLSKEKKLQAEDN